MMQQYGRRPNHAPTRRGGAGAPSQVFCAARSWRRGNSLAPSMFDFLGVERPQGAEPKNKTICQRQMALFLSWCIRIDAGRTGAKGQDVRLLLRHRQGQGLTSANSYVKCRLKSDAESANMRVAHIFAHGEKSAKRLKTKGIPQTQRFAGFLFIGGGGGSRTRVRKRLNRTFSGRSQDLSIPSA